MEQIVVEQPPNRCILRHLRCELVRELRRNGEQNAETGHQTPMVHVADFFEHKRHRQVSQSLQLALAENGD